MIRMKQFVIGMMKSYHIFFIIAPVVGSLSCFSPTTTYIYKVLLNYLPFTIVFSRPKGWPIQRLVKVFLNQTTIKQKVRKKKGKIM